MAREAAALLAASRYSRAEQVSLCAEAKARGESNQRLLAKVLNNLGAARLYQQNFQGAFAALREARELARQQSMAEAEASVWSNLATLYGMLSAWPAAGDALERALALMPGDSRFRPAVLAQRVRLAARRPDLQQGEFARLWSEAMEWAESQCDWQVQRHLWDELATYDLEAGRLGRAEAALANSFRLVALHRLPDRESLWMLAGQVRLAQGRPAEALEWIRRVRSSDEAQQNPVNFLRLAAAEARAEAAVHGPEAALGACRRNWRRALIWRHEVLPDPAVELAADVAMTELVEAYVSAALTARGGPGLSVEGWAAVEQSRALSMLRRKKRRMGAEAGGDPQAVRREGFLTALAEPGRPDPGNLRCVSGARGAVSAAPQAPQALLQMVQSRMSARQALFTFWLGAGRSVLWVVTRDSLTAVPLPSGEEMRREFRRFREEIEQGGDGGESGVRLYRATFGQAPLQAAGRAEWLISADEEPLTVPLAALRMAVAGSPRLGEARALSFLPSALWLLEPRQDLPPRGLLAIGGLVHNSADPRWRTVGSPSTPVPGRPPGPAARRGAPARLDYELPSLPGSGREVQAIAGLWRRKNRAATLLEACNAVEASVREAIDRGLTDIHFATHVRPAPAPRSYRFSFEPGSAAPQLIRFPAGEPFLALSLRRDGVREGLTEHDLARFRLDGVRVVLNGCSSGGGATQRGAGLSSFAGAWLAAGAQSVIASLWPVDDDGTFFETYYRALLEGARPAAALHAAQAAMIRSGTWRSQPRYWAAYIHLGKD